MQRLAFWRSDKDGIHLLVCVFPSHGMNITAQHQFIGGGAILRQNLRFGACNPICEQVVYESLKRGVL